MFDPPRPYWKRGAVLSMIRLAVFAVLLASVVAQSAQDRTAVKGTPVVLGREIPRFVLLEPIRINRALAALTNADRMDRLIGQILPGQLVPVSEDADLVYFQATRGFQREGHTASQPGGLCVSKTRANTIFVYAGEARDLSETLEVERQRLPGADLAKLKIGQIHSGKK